MNTSPEQTPFRSQIFQPCDFSTFTLFCVTIEYRILAIPNTVVPQLRRPVHGFAIRTVRWGLAINKKDWEWLFYERFDFCLSSSHSSCIPENGQRTLRCRSSDSITPHHKWIESNVERNCVYMKYEVMKECKWKQWWGLLKQREIHAPDMQTIQPRQDPDVLSVTACGSILRSEQFRSKMRLREIGRHTMRCFGIFLCCSTAMCSQLGYTGNKRTPRGARLLEKLSHSASQAIPHNLWTPYVYYRNTNVRHSQMNPCYKLPQNFSALL
jgi:hypothetical protein